MNELSIKISPTAFKHLNGAHFPLLIINDELELNSAAYLLHRYNNGTALKTVEREAKALRKFYLFCISNNIDFIGRFSKLERLTIGEIEHLHGVLSLREDTGELVSQTYFLHNWSTILRYIEFLYSFYQSRINDPHRLSTSRIVLEGMRNSFGINAKTPHNGIQNERIGLTPELQVKFLAIIDPTNENTLNPYKSEKVRWRNFCFFMTLMMGGNRKGESLGLKVRHFNLSGSSKSSKYFEIIKEDRTFDDYGRKEIPQVKTKGRKVELTPQLAEIFEYYITKIRPLFKGAKKSEYMFISIRDGKPLSALTPNMSLNDLIVQYPEFKGKLSPHILRNTFHDILENVLDVEFEGVAPIRKQQNKATIQEYAGGWTAGSKMVSHYPKGSIQRKVADLQIRLQEALLSNNGEI
ncbi:site-specific integrase [Shewanella woodyi]|uniref:Integrase family protein n=1 Tax=Shewanella woodyi (strain ATCC 51908 / MS32) TaxID=392500 RepID=B1KNB5_SHEWM|nr:site-specific integrase [Shewanella woodyi]ACA84612.1 integrase family protein [Shewanella woodyi ATCC 51908]